MTLKQGINKIQSLRKAIDTDVKKAVTKSLAQSEREAKRMSSGPLTLGDLKRLDHPYAKRHGALGNVAVMPGKTRSVINVQSGAFRSDWNAYPPQINGQEMRARLANYNAVADYLQYGTKFMVRRPIADYLTDYLHNAAIKNIDAAIKRLERIYG